MTTQTLNSRSRPQITNLFRLPNALIDALARLQIRETARRHGTPSGRYPETPAEGTVLYEASKPVWRR